MVFHPWQDERDLGKRFTDPRYRGGYELPITVVDEELSTDVVIELANALSLLRQLQGLDAGEGLAFLCHLSVVLVDWTRARQGDESVFRGPTWGAIGVGDPKPLQQLSMPPSPPLLGLSSVLKRWRLAGGVAVDACATGGGDGPGRPTYFVFPPRWLPLDAVRDLAAHGGPPAKVPILVDADYAWTADWLASFARATEEAPRPFTISIGGAQPETETDQPEDIFRREGASWVVQYGGSRAFVAGTMGLEYIARLLREPGRSFHVLELAGGQAARSAPSGGPSAADCGRMGLRDTRLDEALPALDPEAKAAYLERLTALEEALGEAEALGNADRVAELSDEKGWLVDQLRGAVGLGGRDRPAGSSAERARTAVRKAIKTALNNIDRHHPALAHHLRNAIRTGTRCSYGPDQPVDWRL